MKEYLPLETLSEYLSLLVLAVQLLHIRPPNRYLPYKPVVFNGYVLVSWSHDRKLMVLSYLKYYIIILQDC